MRHLLLSRRAFCCGSDVATRIAGPIGAPEIDITPRQIASLKQLRESRTGCIKFALDASSADKYPTEGFVFFCRKNSETGSDVRGYVNMCTHQTLELDMDDSDFFTVDEKFLQCKVHGAMFDPATGACAGGPCNGKGLTPLAVEVIGDGIFCHGAHSPLVREKQISAQALEIRQQRAKRRAEKASTKLPSVAPYFIKNDDKQ